MPFANRALVVGINRYPAFSTLQGAENDAQDFYDWVIDPAGGGVMKDNAVLILSSKFAAPANVIDALPDSNLILQFFSECNDSANANNNDGSGVGPRAGKRLWLFFSGHGFGQSLDQSGVLMANATKDMVRNIAVQLWADRLYEGGWFDEVVLFQDACREFISGANVLPPELRRRTAPAAQTRRRFYAFSAKEGKLSKELPRGDGTVHGVFTTTLLQGLRHARNTKTGAVTTATLTDYLHVNMRTYLSPADLENDDIAQEPGVVFDPFDIVPPEPAGVMQFPVRITLPIAGLTAEVQDGDFKRVDTANPAPQIWNLQLPRGLYRLVAKGPKGRKFADRNFAVTGEMMSGGKAAVVDVRA
jgi:hypothetical protein